MSDATLYTEIFIEHAEDGFRHRYGGEKGEWKTKSSFDGLWCDEIDQIVIALTSVARGYKEHG